MKAIRWMLPLFGSLIMATTASAQSGDIQFASNVNLLNERIAELESRLASVESTEVAFGSGAAQTSGCKSGKCGGGKSGKGGGGCWCSPCAGVIAEAELLILNFTNDGDFGTNAMHSGSRYTFGVINESGRSLRARWFEFASIDQPGAAGDDELRVETLDVEYAGRFALGCDWYGEVSLGGRWAQLFEDEDDTDINDGYGLVLGAELRSCLRDGLDIYAGARYSIMRGYDLDEDETVAFAISELRTGIEAQRCTAIGDVFVRTGVEAQRWDGEFDGASSINMMGVTVAAGLSR